MTGYVVGALWRGFVVLCLGVLLLAAPLGRAEAVEVNTPPTVRAGADQTVVSGATVTLRGTVTDPDAGQTLDISWIDFENTITGLLENPNALETRFTAPTLAVGAAPLALRYRLQANDRAGSGTVSDEVLIIVQAPVNRPPEVSAGADITVPSGSVVNLVGTASDPDGQALTYLWRWPAQVGGTLTGERTLTPSFTAPVLMQNTPSRRFVLSFTVNDGWVVINDTLTVTVLAPTNAAPVANAGVGGTIASGASVNLNGGATDTDAADVPNLTYSWTATAAGGADAGSFNNSNAKDAIYTAPILAVGDNDRDVALTLTVSDGRATGSAQIVYTVQAPTNAPPVISAGPPREVASGATVTLAGSASDADAGDRLSYRWTGPSNVTINDADTLNPTFVAPTLPLNGNAEVLDFTLTVSDGRVDVSEAVAVTVFAKRNVPPQASPDYTANGANVTLYPAAFDADGDMLTYAWSYVSGPQVTISSADEENATLVLPTLPWTPSPEQIVVELVVTDDDGATATYRLSLSALVSERPALLVNAGNDVAVFSGSSVNLEGKALGDGTSPISFRWTVTDGITFNDPTSEVPSFIAPVVTEPTVFTVTLTVTEGVETADGPVRAIGANASPAAPPGPGSGPAANPTLRTASDTLTVTVLPIVTPVLNVSGPTSVIEGDRVTLTASVVPDGDYGIWWAQMAGPSVLEYKDGRDTKRVASPVPNGPDGPGGGRPIEKVFGPTISFTAPMVPAGQEELVLVFEALVLRGFDSVSRIVSVTVKRAGTSDDPQGPTAEETEVAVNRFVQMRITNVLALQPDLSAIMGGGDGTANLTMSSMGGQIDMATAPDKPFWLRLKGSWSSIAGAKGDYVLGSAGAHVKVSDGLALGVMAQVDHLETVDGLAVAKGTGYLVGPYVVAKLPDQALTVQGRLLYGAASNDFAPIGTFVDRFDSTRLLASVGLSGQIDKGSVVWKPSLQAAYAREDTDSYTDGFGNLISPGTTAMAQVSAGMEVTFALPVPAGGMTATLGLTNIWSGSLEGAATAFEGHRGKVSVGVNRVFASGAQLSLAASYDGLGTGDYESAGLDLLFQHKF